MLDEPTTHLDPDTRDAVLDDILAATAGRRSCWSPTTSSRLDRFDEVAVVVGGRVVQRGPHAELIAADGWYRSAHGRAQRTACPRPSPGADRLVCPGRRAGVPPRGRRSAGCRRSDPPCHRPPAVLVALPPSSRCSPSCSAACTSGPRRSDRRSGRADRALALDPAGRPAAAGRHPHPQEPRPATTRRRPRPRASRSSRTRRRLAEPPPHGVRHAQPGARPRRVRLGEPRPAHAAHRGDRRADRADAVLRARLDEGRRSRRRPTGRGWRTTRCPPTSPTSPRSPRPPCSGTRRSSGCWCGTS